MPTRNIITKSEAVSHTTTINYYTFSVYPCTGLLARAIWILSPNLHIFHWHLIE